MKIYLLFVIATTLLVGCTHKSFTVSGEIEGAESEMLYLEHLSLAKTVILDSVKMKKSSFSFKSDAPLYPDLYRLRFKNQHFIFPVDSTEHIVVKATADSFSYPEIENSTSAVTLQALRKSVSQLQANYGALQRNEIVAEDLMAQIEEHKEKARQIILENPRSIVAYYAVFQKLGDYFVFTPYDPADRPYCAAVATAFNAFMPEYNRTKSLYSVVLDAIKSDRAAKNNELLQALVDSAETSFLEIELGDKDKVSRKLSSLKGKVVLLDFSMFESEQSVQHTFALRDLHNKYAARGFEIYQVSADRNQLLWEQSVENLPWVSVRDKNGPRATCFTTYNVQSLPTIFLLDKKGEIVGRNLSMEALEQAIEQCLKK